MVYKRGILAKNSFYLYNSVNLENVQCESYKLFSLGQNEDYSPGHSISDSTEKLLQRYKVGGWGQNKCDFGEWGVQAIKHIIFAECFC